jgi:hypothetical protein
LNLADEPPLDCTTNHLAVVGVGQEGDGQKLISMEEADNTVQEHPGLQGELVPHHRS